MVHGVINESVTPFKYVFHGELVMKVLPIQICGSWRVSDESVTPFKYVVHGELVMKLLPHSNMWFMESY